jgi:6-pyruvoyltetrahydropterin/6-carboxytetrahydropterin synthase
MKIGIIDHIDCAHFLPGHPKCGSLHGHTYKVELVIEGDVRNGMIMDFADQKQAMREILRRYDHKSWNEFLEYPSVENICQLLHEQLGTQFKLSYTLRVWEGEGKWAEL